MTTYWSKYFVIAKIVWFLVDCALKEECFRHSPKEKVDIENKKRENKFSVFYLTSRMVGDTYIIDMKISTWVSNIIDITLLLHVRLHRISISIPEKWMKKYKLENRKYIHIVWVKMNNTGKWLFYDHYWPFFANCMCRMRPFHDHLNEADAIGCEA